MKSVDVNIIIPIYNGRRFLEKTINSCINQTYKHFDIIIIDDKSTDGSLELIKSQFSSLENIIILENKENRGINYTVNKAVRLSNGKMVLFLGQDDLLSPNHLEEMTKDFDDTVSFIHCNSKIIDANDIFLKWSKYDDDQIKKSKEPLKFLAVENFISSTGAIINRRYFESLGGFDESYKNYGEWLNWIKLSSCGTVIYNKDIYAFYRKHTSNISNTFQQKPIELLDYWKACKKRAEELSNINILTRCYIKINMRLLKLFRAFKVRLENIRIINSKK